jgi:DNA-binding beta-propeller fold protein YncE
VGYRFRGCVTLDGSDDIAIVNLVRKRVRRYLSTGKSPHDVLFAPGGSRVWVTDWSGSVHLFSRWGKLLKSINRGVELHHLAFTRDGRQAWVTDGGGNRVFVISARSLRVVASRRTRRTPPLRRAHARRTQGGHSQSRSGNLAVFTVSTRLNPTTGMKRASSQVFPTERCDRQRADAD